MRDDAERTFGPWVGKNLGIEVHLVRERCAVCAATRGSGRVDRAGRNSPELAASRGLAACQSLRGDAGDQSNCVRLLVCPLRLLERKGEQHHECGRMRSQVPCAKAARLPQLPLHLLLARKGTQRLLHIDINAGANAGINAGCNMAALIPARPARALTIQPSKSKAKGHVLKTGTIWALSLCLACRNSRAALARRAPPPRHLTSTHRDILFGGWTLPLRARSPSAGRHLRLRRPGLIAAATKSMDAFDLVSKERVNTLRPACRSCRQSSSCRAPSTRSGYWDLGPPAAAGGRPGSMYRLRGTCESTPEPLRHRRPCVPCRRRPSTLLKASSVEKGAAGTLGRSWRRSSTRLLDRGTRWWR